jgi:hypothetical protein
MSEYYQSGFFYDSVKIRHINKLCHRYADNRLWDNDTTTEYDGKAVIEDNPPMSTYDIALLQVALSQEVDYVASNKPIVAAFSVDWKSDRSDFTHHIVRFDIVGHNVDLSCRSEQERIEWSTEAEKMRGMIDLFFDRIASICTAHYLAQLNAPIKTALFGIPDDLHYKSTKVKLPDGYGMLLLTLVSSVDSKVESGTFTTEEAMCNIVSHFNAFGPQKR